MTTRGGVAKAQKGLHLNEDIFGGMTAFNRGGRIKHAEYYQCGKGRDLGFGTILNFQTKIGTGMGEQMISREYYYLGTQLPTDRFLTFYYGHGGFHVNNTLVIFSVQIITVTREFVDIMEIATDILKCSSLVHSMRRLRTVSMMTTVITWVVNQVATISIQFTSG